MCPVNRDPENGTVGTQWVWTNHILSEKMKFHLTANSNRQTVEQIGQTFQRIRQTVQQMGHTFFKIGQNITQSAKTFFFLCLNSNSDVYGLLAHLEQISNLRAPADYCALKEFRVWTKKVLEPCLKLVFFFHKIFFTFDNKLP